MGEGQILDDQSDGGAEEYFREQDEIEYQNSINAMQRQYEDNKWAAIGTTIRCPSCFRKIIKYKFHVKWETKGEANHAISSLPGIKSTGRSRYSYLATVAKMFDSPATLNSIKEAILLAHSKELDLKDLELPSSPPEPKSKLNLHI